MIPREHGGWAMLLIPYFIGVGVAARFGLEPVLFLLSIVLVFMASEPLGILARARGAKSRRTGAQVLAAIRWLLIYLLLAGLATAPLVVLYRRWWLVLFGLAGAVFLVLQAVIEGRRLDRTLSGELIGALGLSLSAPGAYYVTTGALDLTALLLWLLTSLHSAGSVFYINMRIRHRVAKTKGASIRGRLQLAKDTLVYLLVLAVVLLGLSFLGQLPFLVIVAFLPLACRAAKAIYEAKPEFSFKRLGLVELANSIVFAALLILSRIVP